MCVRTRARACVCVCVCEYECICACVLRITKGISVHIRTVLSCVYMSVPAYNKNCQNSVIKCVTDNNSRPLYSYNPVHKVNCQNTDCSDTNTNSDCDCSSPSKFVCACDVYSKQYSCEG